MTSPIKDKEPLDSLALVRAASSGDLPEVESLLAAGVEVNCHNEDGQTALIRAALMGHAEVVAHLISAGADPHLRDRLNLTALEWSTRRGFLEVTQLLTKISPPLQPVQAERKKDQTESATQSSELSTTEQVPANPETPDVAEMAAATTEQVTSEEPGTLSPQPELVETSTSENLIEPAVVATESAPSLTAVPHPTELLANEAESQPTTTEVEVTSTTTEESPEVSAPAVNAAASDLEVPPSSIPEASLEVSAPAVNAAASDLEVPPSSIPEASLEVSAPAVNAAATEMEVLPTPELSPESAPAVSAAATELEVVRSPTTEASPEVNAPALDAAPTELEGPPSPITEPAPELSASVENVTTTELEVSPAPMTEASAEVGAPAVNSASTELKVPPPPTTESSAEVSATAVNAAPSELEVPPSPATEATPEVSASALKATPTSDLQSWDPDYDADRVLATDAVLQPEEDETLPQPRVPASTVDIRFPESPSATASAETREVLPPAAQISAPESRPAPFSGLNLGGLSTSAAADVGTSARNLKRCPRCGAVYQNTPLSFCTRDNATLIWVDEFHPFVATPTRTSSTPIGVWLLIAFVLGASGFAAYRVTESFYRQPVPTPAVAKPLEAPPEVKKPTFIVGGNLAGRELTIPEPEYPSDLIAAGITGPITVRVRVNKSGRVISASSSGGDSRLRSAAVKAARQATFAPDKLAEISPRGRAVTGSITYEFAAPQTSTAPSTATTSTTAASGPGPVPSSSPANSDPNAPVVGNELMSAATNVPAAEYPSRAQRAGIGGSITVTVRVNRNGKVVSWRSSPGDSQLRAAAIKAARKATFAREKLPSGGDVVGTITYNFVP